MKNTRVNIERAINNYEESYRESKNGTVYKFNYAYAGTSVFDAGSVYAEYVTVFSIARGVTKNYEFTGRHYTSNGSEYPKGAYIR